MVISLYGEFQNSQDYLERLPQKQQHHHKDQKKITLFISMYGYFVFIHICAPHASSTRGEERVTDPLGPDHGVMNSCSPPHKLGSTWFLTT